MFIGETEFKPGMTWVGLHLDDPIGKNNGTVDGVKYFDCPPDHGVFVPSSKITQERVSLKSQKKEYLTRQQLEDKMEHLKTDLDNAMSQVSHYKAVSSGKPDMEWETLQHQLSHVQDENEGLKHEIADLKSRTTTDFEDDHSGLEQVIHFKTNESIDLRSQVAALRKDHAREVSILRDAIETLKLHLEGTKTRGSMDTDDLKKELDIYRTENDRLLKSESLLKSELTQMIFF